MKISFRLSYLPLILLCFVILAFAIIPVLRQNLIVAAELMISGNMSGLRDYILSFGIAAPLVSFLLMIFQAFVSPIPSILIFIVNGAIFGKWLGFFLSWFSSLASALFCFWLARQLGRPFVAQFVKAGFLAEIDDFLAHYGSMAVMLTRMLPFMPFDFTSYAFGLSRVTWWSFTWGTAVGQTPAIVFYNFLGYRSFAFWEYVLYFTLWLLLLIILTPLISRWLKKKEQDSITTPHS
ncbi:TVP38/TMEM64 family protein [Heliorestis acidaminivorans]|uniref:TVP38/TMEM64 family membrane protein n=1 Tax=Heliorestis acidaminivorans TaxID=553427 RepID=A0A6I0EVY0_9FIRM|nr:TVP38/TMEM64 family protein [Heliorestis acidaminivorans]KAB2954574.1 TVP38/TMEM64 family protein [Heliorestis acidaminivorans]